MITPDQLAKSGTEHGHQAALFCWSALPEVKAEYPQLKWLFAVPNGFFATPGQKAKMKAEGLKEGVPDIWLPISIRIPNRIVYCGLVIELKTPEKKKANNPLAGTSETQEEYIDFLIRQGYRVLVAYGWEEARDIIIKYLEL